ncbi:uncharacterized protein LOC142644429 [Castanea sativa]|uniref:uncharacterized protein LOC142644429 n=1 Tax=Castanea sativa TaxID=21020 RepID=UPI003F64D012
MVETLTTHCKLMRAENLSWVYGLSSLKVLDLGGVDLSNAEDWLDAVNLLPSLLQGVIPDAIGNLASLISLDLSKNGLKGPIPLTLGLFQEQGEFNKSSSLRELYLSSNGLNGSLARSLAQFSQLVVLDVAMNCMDGSIKEAHLLKFSSLRVLDLSSNSLALEVSSSWIPPFQLETIGLRCARLVLKPFFQDHVYESVFQRAQRTCA